MKLVWKAEDVLRAVRGHCLHEQTWTAHGVSIDSRTLQPGDLFIAIIGPEKDAHDYVVQAFSAGAAAAIVQRPPAQVPSGAPLLIVEDSFAALQDLGRVGRQRSQAKIVAVTGSVGKTGSKEQLRVILEANGDTHANEGSLNNHWGVPLSLARLPADARYGVFEIGMNHAGELGPLSREVHPHVSLITNVEAVHLEYFDSVEAIADAKAEIFLGMDPGGTAVLNRDNPHFARLLAAARTQGLKRILSFGRDAKSDARLLGFKADENGSEVEAVILDQKVAYRLGTPGEHVALNSLGALLAAAAAGADIMIGLDALASYRPPQGRGTRRTVTLQDGGRFLLIDESYNASPVSMRAAIQVLGRTPPGPGGRRIAVLGDMRELGASSPQLHAGLASSLAEAGIDSVHCCGAMMAHLYEALPLPLKGHKTMDSRELAQLMADDVHEGDVVMVKGSHSLHMEIVVEALGSLGNGGNSPRRLAS
ncbi:MAG: UDP-N-acetylmuramoylalanyl-D-glutamyl-2,6-diaminopimelate--D-alanyl-D-alanine ligase [Alphaproteobacteria bacterium]|nr:UDP-N-acetylmuramoylalanyl-D-glutamyl-2,6-diaminopimelate--D-alanyl-D-alanine ligase [Alphaproteobacteria bacterium]